MLYHMAMVYDIDTDKMPQVLWTRREKPSDKGTKSANKCIDLLCSQTQLSRDQTIDSFPEHLESCYFTRRHNYADDELMAVAELAEEGFVTPE